MRVVPLAMRMLSREWRSGELGVLLFALTIAVAALTGVGFLVSRISAAVAMQASEVLAADLRLESPQPIEAADMAAAHQDGLLAARATSLLSVVFAGDQSQLTDIDAVTDGYPLRGAVMVADQPFAKGVPASGIPVPGEVWPDSRLLAALGGHVGSRLTIGAADLRVGRVLISRPDEGGTFTGLVPNLLMNAADLARTQLIQPGSRATYAALFAGTPERVAAFKHWLRSQRYPGERLRDISTASPQIKSAVDRAGRFLSLASLVAVLLCATAVAMSARRYVRRHLDSVALLKTLGATRGFTVWLTTLQLLAVALLSAAIGSAFGYLAQAWLVYALRGLLASRALPPASLVPLGMGLLTAIALLAGFALPPLLQLSRVPAIRVLRRDIGPPRPMVLLAFGPAVAVVVLLIYWVVLDWKLFLGFTAGLAAFIVLLVLTGSLLVVGAGRLRAGAGVAWRHGVASLSRRRADSIVQIVAFGTGIMALLLLGIIRSDLDGDWRRSLPADLPNYFFINIPPQSRDAFTAYLRARGARTSRVLPMIRGRLTAIDGRPVQEMHFRDHRGDEFANREQNLTWSAALGTDNRVVAGRWWTPADTGRPLVSVSTEFEQWLGLHLGDQLTFDIAGESFTVRVASIRKVKWDSFRPNFFIVFAPGMLDKVAGTYLTSAYMASGTGESLAGLAHRFPSVSIFDIDDLLADVRSVLDKAVLAVQSVFAFTLLAGLTVLLAAVQSSRDERRYESAILRTLGASRRTVLRGVLAEFAALGILSGLIAAAGASIAAYFLTTRVLDLRYVFSPWACVVGLLGGALVVVASGWLATRSVVRQPPLATLRADV
ncbi:MAG TPA: FtsX-like permease family protein [Steroidobacteraceae bacterium]|jgi:putative ABC transport system permease protein|nr:FtsX-like permease family protein [Steroidobacteraceae bacterium]